MIDKPPGITSHDAVDRVRRALGTRRVGHAGTLDPMATGLLLVGVGRATRLLRFLGDLPKLYAGSAVLGVETTTLDSQGEVIREREVSVTRADLLATVDSFTGEIEQIPPAYSAVKVGGRRLYQAARSGQPVEAAPRLVTVHEFEVTRFVSPRFDFTVRCSSGTYVRSLAADVGSALGCGAHLVELRRTAIGPFRVQDARPPEEPGPLLPVEAVVGHLPAVRLQAAEAVAASHGSILGPSGIVGPHRAIGPDGTLIGIYRDDGAKAVPEVILTPA